MAKSYFKQEYDLEKRIAEAARLRDQYPDRIPMIVEKAERSDIPSIDKKKWYLVRGEMTVEQFRCVICKKIGLSAKNPIVILMDDVLLPTDAAMSAIYDEKKDEDGFLYVTYSGKNTSQMLNVVDLMMDNPLLAAAYGIGVDSRKEWDVKEDENVVILRIPIPGFDKEEVQISVEQNMLAVKGEGGKESKDEEDDVRSFYSQVYIPPELYKMHSIKAVMKNGVLKIRVPKVNEEEQKEFFKVMVS